MKPFVIGITGNIGSGKSTVGEIIAKHGIEVIDTDHLVHQILGSDPGVKNKIIKTFGQEVISTGGENVDKAKLASIVFNDAKKRKELEAILHPAVIILCREKLKTISKKSAAQTIVAILVPLLFEANLEKEYDQIWTVLANEKAVRERLKQSRKMTDLEITNRLNAQLCQDKKAAKSDVIIDNSKDLEHTKTQIITQLENIRKSINANIN